MLQEQSSGDPISFSVRSLPGDLPCWLSQWGSSAQSHAGPVELNEDRGFEFAKGDWAASIQRLYIVWIGWRTLQDCILSEVKLWLIRSRVRRFCGFCPVCEFILIASCMLNSLSCGTLAERHELAAGVRKRFDSYLFHTRVLKKRSTNKCSLHFFAKADEIILFSWHPHAPRNLL